MHKHSRLWLISTIIVALSISWIHNQWRHQQQFTAKIDQSRIDYYLNNFSLLTTNHQGQLQYHLKATHLVHNVSNKDSEIINPLIIVQQQNSTITIQAKQAKQHLSGEIELSGKVLIKKSESPIMAGFQLNTQTLSYSPSLQLLKTKSKFSIKTTQGDTITGIGLTEDLNNHTLRIQSKVRAIIIPK